MVPVSPLGLGSHFGDTIHGEGGERWAGQKSHTPVLFPVKGGIRSHPLPGVNSLKTYYDLPRFSLLSKANIHLDATSMPGVKQKGWSSSGGHVSGRRWRWQDPGAGLSTSSSWGSCQPISPACSRPGNWGELELCTMKTGKAQRRGGTGSVHIRSKVWELQRSSGRYPEISRGSFTMDFTFELHRSKPILPC